MQRLHDEGARPLGQWLFAPMIDDCTAADASLDETGHWVWSNADNRFGWSAYLHGEPGAEASPRTPRPRGATTSRGSLPRTSPSATSTSSTPRARRTRLGCAAGVDVELDVVPVAGLAFAPWFFYVFRFVAGAGDGIGGDCAAINSAIDEIIPSRYRGRVDDAINGTYWAGAALGAVASAFFLDTSIFPQDLGWRLSFFIGPVLGLLIIYLRRHLPGEPALAEEHGREEETERTVDGIEERIRREGREIPPVDESKAITVREHGRVPFLTIASVLFRKYPRRTLVGVTMMVTQSFLYHAIFFTYALVLQNFYGIPPGDASIYFIVFALGNLCGALFLGHVFDTWGPRRMIFGTYVLAGLVLLVSAFLFDAGVLNALSPTIFWCVSLFFASAGASAAYLTVSEIFPLELRSQVISYVFSVGQLVGAPAPVLFGDGTSRGPLFWGYVLGSVVMILGGVVSGVFGVSAAGRSLEDVADRLSLVSKPDAGATPET